MSEDAPTLPINTIVLIVTFLGIFAFLLSLVVAESPTLFINDPQTYRSIDVPEHFESVDVLYYADTYSNIVPYTGLGGLSFSVGGWDFEFRAPVLGGNIYLQRGKHWGVVLYGWHQLKWFDERGRDVTTYYLHNLPRMTPETIDQYFDPKENASRFLSRDDEMQIDIYFSYNQNIYDNCTDAWSNDALTFLGAVSFDQQNTGMNVWSMLGMLLFFQLPSMHPIVNFIIALPIWACIVTLIAIVIYHVIISLPFT